MKAILSQGNRQILEEFAWSNVLLAFDYDGTLAPIVVDPTRAVMRSRTADRLQTLALLYPVVVISGRARADVSKRLKGAGIRNVVGNHGIEPWLATERIMGEVRRWVPVLRERMSAFRGVRIEDKDYSIAVHYRQSREKKRARAAILEAAELLGDVRVIGGKQVVNILPRRAPHKGLALERERDRLGCDTAVYVGDDETDEDVFGLEQAGRLLTIRVGAKRSSQAAFCIRCQAEIDELLGFLIDVRRHSRRRREVQS